MWNTICIEGFCFGEESEDKYPCGQRYPTAFCLYNHKCPYFVWANTNEREVSCFVPFRLLLWDRLLAWTEMAKDKITWIFWDQLWFNRKKVDDFFKGMQKASPVELSEEDTLQLPDFLRDAKEKMRQFPAWFEGAKKEVDQYEGEYEITK